MAAAITSPSRTGWICHRCNDRQSGDGGGVTKGLGGSAGSGMSARAYQRDKPHRSWGSSGSSKLCCLSLGNRQVPEGLVEVEHALEVLRRVLLRLAHQAHLDHREDDPAEVAGLLDRPARE